jgi:hypothetical protein
MPSSRAAIPLLSLLLLPACGIQPIEVRHGPVAGFAPAAASNAPPIAVAAREKQPTDRIRIGTVLGGGRVDRRIGFPIGNDLAAELREALAAALRQRGLTIAAADAAVLRLDVAIEEADALTSDGRAEPSIMALPTGPAGITVVPVSGPAFITSRVAARATLRDRAGAARFTQRYEHSVTREHGLLELNTAITRAGLEEGLRSVVRQIAEDPDLIRAVATAR